ncbi:MAG: helix-turn-helix domain-containing protein [Desulfobacteraceae bacterium]|nr:helix-turn-helix domain-containing protein [Desulfobacteraceae bacterium]
MKLTQPEVIQILRRRLGMNQGDFGARAFDTTFESGRTKIKNIELGKQVPTDSELAAMARVFGTDVSVLKPESLPSPTPSSPGSVQIDAKVVELFPGLSTYLDMLNKAARLEDAELIDHIASKLASVLSASVPTRKARSR